jgi:predicted ATP-grasp superfamily ATP-dependent carboligase
VSAILALSQRRATGTRFAQAARVMRSGNTMSQSLFILGASTRAAAFSALAAGFAPRCGDQFADADLAARCAVAAVDDYPRGLAEIAQRAPDIPWMYTGALENYPDLVAHISSRQLLLGNGADGLRRIRDPFEVHKALARSGVAVPEVRTSPEGLPRDGSWLRKSRHSSGGSGVESWSGVAPCAIAATGTHYYQRRISGTAAAAIYLAAGGDIRLLGATEQILNSRTGHEDAFRYAGSVGPLPLDGRQATALEKIGRTLSTGFGLSGLFGVDFVDDGQEIWPVEVNPRYTASVEILERGLQFSAVGGHVAACRDGLLPATIPMAGRRWHAKRVIFAPRELEISEAFTRDALAQNSGRPDPSTADIPRPGTRIRAGRPVMTVFSHGPSRALVLEELERARHYWESKLLRQPLGSSRK